MFKDKRIMDTDAQEEDYQDEEEEQNTQQRKLYVGTDRGVILTVDIS